MADIIETAWRAGARFDLWDECFDYELWQSAFAASDLDLETAAARPFACDEILPWEHLGGPDKSYLLTHYTAARDLMQDAPIQTSTAE